MRGNIWLDYVLQRIARDPGNTGSLGKSLRQCSFATLGWAAYEIDHKVSIAKAAIGIADYVYLFQGGAMDIVQLRFAMLLSMELLLSLLPVILVGGALYLFVITLRGALILTSSEQVAWTLAVILAFPFGSILFLV